MEIKTRQRDAILHIEPYKSAAAEVRAMVGEKRQVAPLANLDRRFRTAHDAVECFGRRNVPAVMKHAIREDAMHQLAELLVAKEVA